MEYHKVSLSLKQSITVGRETKFDKLEIYVGGEVTPEPGQSPEQALIELGVALHAHLEKEFDMAAKNPSAAVEAAVQQKAVNMAPPQTQPAQQTFTAKPKPYNCIEPGCDQRVEQANRRCWPHYKAWNASRGNR